MTEQPMIFDKLPSLKGTFRIETEDGITHYLSNVNGLSYTQNGETTPIKEMDFDSWKVGGVGLLYLISGYLDSPAEVRTSKIISITEEP